METRNYINEVWKPIVGYVGLYEVSNFGRVRSFNQYLKTRGSGIRFKGGRILKLSLNKKTGYLNVHLSKNGKEKKFYVHRLVAEAFIPNPNNYPCVNHRDCCKTNNHVDNLEWVTHQTNLTYKDAQIKRVEALKKTCALNHPFRFNTKCKPVIQYTLEGEFIKEWPSCSEVERELGYYRAGLLACCRQRIKQAYGYLWAYK